MADEVRVAKRYAAALFDVAQRDGALDAVSADVDLVERFMVEVPYLRSMVTQPLVSADRKRKVLSDAFGDRTTATTLNFLYLLVRKRRENLLDQVIADYRAIVNEKLGHVVAQVYSAVALDFVQLQALEAALSARTGKNVTIEAIVDPTTIGGIKVRLGDNVIDGTIHSGLEKVRAQLLGVV
ncbi:MAG TPA: F0F1 ATP synthase subunit delta [Capsulimonadaceae bacterium]|jgi:F-type H+-transporting ATPase subunit delta